MNKSQQLSNSLFLATFPSPTLSVLRYAWLFPISAEPQITTVMLPPLKEVPNILVCENVQVNNGATTIALSPEI